MWEFVSKLFTSDFMPHGHCFFWRPEVLWLHVGADSLIALSYFSIPLALLTIVKRRRDIIYNRMFLLFAAFIFLCGTTHLFGIWAMWNGTYRLEGVVKLLTGIVSLCTAILLWRLIPNILSLPSRAKLEEEINRRKDAQTRLERIQQDLEEKVLERTAELELANQRLKHWAHIVDSSNDGIAAITVDGTITSWNPAAERIFGYKLDEIIGSSINLVMDAPHREEFSAIMTKVAQGEPLSDFETVWRDKNNSPYDVSLTVSRLSSPRAQRLEGFSIMIRDIRERKKQEERFKIAVEAAPNGMLLINAQGRIVLANEQAGKMSGYPSLELVGSSVDQLLPPELRARDRLRADWLSVNGVRPVGTMKDLAILRRDGKRIPVEMGLTPIETSDGVMTILAIVDITERKESQERIQNSLEQKELLLKEVHHRVKNNLQVISSLLKIQSRYVLDEKTKSMFRESEDRVRSMALVHDKLYHSAELNRVEFKSYVQDLLNELCRTYVMDNQPVKVEMDIGEVELNIEKAIPCGLMLNELISNALKHAFSEPVDGREWKLRIDLHVCEGKPDTFEVIVADNGLGLPEGIDVDKPDSMGLRVIRTLCEQLKGRLEIASSEAGTTFKLIFSTGGNGRPTKERSHEPTDEHISM